jgi:ribosomal protein S18 acetylase RimI-like enzyme
MPHPPEPRQPGTDIRALAPADAAAFQALRLRALQECPAAFASSYEEEVGTPLAKFEARLQPRAGSAVFGAFRDSGLCALVGIQRESGAKLAHKSFLWGVYVAPEVRGAGLGTRLVAHALRYAAEVLGTRQVNLGVNTQNAAAVALYRKLGFVEYGLERGYLLVDGVPQDEFLMVCRLAPAADPSPT